MAATTAGKKEVQGQSTNVAPGDRLRVLVVDDDAPARRALSSFIARKGDIVRECEDGTAALQIMAHETIDVVLSDVRMPRLDGISLVRAVREKWEETSVVLMTAYATVDSVINALREGAYDYLLKPIDPAQLTVALDRARERILARRKNRALIDEVAARDVLGALTGAGPIWKGVIEQVKRAAGSDLSVLVTGETGTGKDAVAKAIHGLSSRSTKPLTMLHAAQMTPQELDAALLATHGGRGRTADGGTLLIDDLSALSPESQTRLLQLLEHKNIELPDGTAIPADVRVIATGGLNIPDDVRDGHFKPELYYRLRVVELNLPPLRERREDIPALVEHFLRDESARRGATMRITPQALSLLMACPWPGNVRELENVTRASAALATSDTIDPTNLPQWVRAGSGKTSRLSEQVQAYERAVLRQALEQVHGQVGRAAEVLGVPERTLRRKMRLFGLAKEAFRRPIRPRPAAVFGH